MLRCDRHLGGRRRGGRPPSLVPAPRASLARAPGCLGTDGACFPHLPLQTEADKNKARLTDLVECVPQRPSVCSVANFCAPAPDTFPPPPLLPPLARQNDLRKVQVDRYKEHNNATRRLELVVKKIPWQVR